MEDVSPPSRRDGTGSEPRVDQIPPSRADAVHLSADGERGSPPPRGGRRRGGEKVSVGEARGEGGSGESASGGVESWGGQTGGGGYSTFQHMFIETLRSPLSLTHIGLVVWLYTFGFMLFFVVDCC